MNKFLEKLRRHREVTKKEESHLTRVIDQFYDIRNYPFTVMELSQNIDEERVAEVFVRINSR